MPTPFIRHRTVFEFDSGSETVRVEQESITSLTSRDKYDAIKVLADDAADGDVVLYDQGANNVFSAAFKPTAFIIFVDPDDDMAAVIPIAIQLRDTAANLFNISLDRRAPVFIRSNAAFDNPPSLATMTGFITKITARNNNAAPSEGNYDCPVRIIALR
jgi:hypothetical protein